MRNRILAITALTCFSASAMAVPIDFEASYSIEAHDSGDGLLIETGDIESNPFDFTLDIDGDNTYTTDLFRIWTNEGSVNDGEDTVPRAISVDFAFTAPEAGVITAEGATSGDVENEVYIWGALIYWQDVGELAWDAPVWDYNFGNGGLLQVSLFGAEFNEGFYGLNNGLFGNGYWHGSDVGAQFTLVRAPVSVPEPGTLILLGAGLVGFGLVRRRRNHA